VTTIRRWVTLVAVIAAAALLVWGLVGTLPRPSGAPRSIAAAGPAEPAPPGRKIKARLFYLSEDGSSLTSVEREVAYGESPAAQARAIVEAQIAPVDDPVVSAIPPGTTLRALFATPDGEAFVDFNSELTNAHPGGSLMELLTIYSIVNAVTVNLPAITAVQILVEGKEVDTLAGHVDLRQPLVKNLSWVQ
jgi:spore germination protein GerM